MLSQGYGITAPSIEYVTRGLDAAALTWIAVDGSNRAWFLKAKPVLDRTRLEVTRYLHDHGLAPVVAPLPTASGELSATLGALDLVVFPLVEGVPAIEGGLSEGQWVDYGRFVRALHDVTLPERLALQLVRESFGGAAAAAVRALDPNVAAYSGGDAARIDMAANWRARHSMILALIDRAEAARQQINGRDQPPELVVCHSDIHVGNVIAGLDGGIHVVDWDDLRLAPRERDLKFVVPGRIGQLTIEPEHVDLFMRGYGDYAVDQELLAWYGDEWIVVDIAEYAATVFLQQTGPVTRLNAVAGFRALFD